MWSPFGAPERGISHHRHHQPSSITNFMMLHYKKRHIRDILGRTNFSLPESEYMELELRSVERQGPTRQGARQWGRRAPTLVDRVWAPSHGFFF